MDWRNGVGFYPANPDGIYDESYYNRYVEYGRTELGRELTIFRAGLVAKYLDAGTPLVDVGIGAGTFIQWRGGETYGYDVNPCGIRWLLERERWWDPYFKDAPAASCWDSLEHMERPREFVERVRGYLFLSLPIFRDLPHAISSKHFKPREHYWYFTRDGLVAWMDKSGMALLEECTTETFLGRESIGTFVFRRGHVNG